jgi:hypothetical protein
MPSVIEMGTVCYLEHMFCDIIVSILVCALRKEEKSLQLLWWKHNLSFVDFEKAISISGYADVQMTRIMGDKSFFTSVSVVTVLSLVHSEDGRCILLYFWSSDELLSLITLSVLFTMKQP